MTFRRVLRVLLLAPVFVATAAATGQSLNEAGKAAYSRGDYAEAERLFRQAAATAPREPLYRYHLAVALTRLGRYREAGDAYEATLRLDPDRGLAEAARQGLRELSVTSSARRPPAEPDETSIALQRIAGVWVTLVKLNDVRPARFLVDTGATFTILSTGLADELRIRSEPGARPVRLQTGNGPITARPVTIPSIKVGELEATGVPAVVADIGPGFEGILGNTFLGRYTVVLDPRRGILSLRPR